MLSGNAMGVITLARVHDDEPDRPGPAFLVERLELDERPAAWAPLLDAVAKGNITLLDSSRDTEHNNNALALRDYVVVRLEAAASR